MPRLLIFALMASSLQAAVEEETYPAKNLKQVVVENTFGNITLIGQEVTEAKLTIEKIEWHPECVLNKTDSATTISIKIEHQNANKPTGIAPNCHANISLTLPNTKVIKQSISTNGYVFQSGINGSGTYKIGQGNLRIQNANIPDLTIHIGEGNADLENTTVSYSTIHIGKGNFSLSGLLKNSEFNLSTGDATFKYFSKPTVGELKLNMAQGNATFSLPDSTILNASLDSGLGGLKSTITRTKNAKFNINMHVGMGNLIIN